MSGCSHRLVIEFRRPSKSGGSNTFNVDTPGGMLSNTSLMPKSPHTPPKAVEPCAAAQYTARIQADCLPCESSGLTCTVFFDMVERCAGYQFKFGVGGWAHERTLHARHLCIMSVRESFHLALSFHHQEVFEVCSQMRSGTPKHTFHVATRRMCSAFPLPPSSCNRSIYYRLLHSGRSVFDLFSYFKGSGPRLLD